MSGMSMGGMSDMSMATSMPSSTAMSMATSGADAMSMTMRMDMTFFTSSTTALYSNAWTPTTTGQYAGTCIFLIVLALILRCLYAFKHVLEVKWANRALQRRYVVVAGSASSTTFDSDTETLNGAQGQSRRRRRTEGAKSGTLTTNGMDENVKVVESRALSLKQPWRLSVDLPRALLVTVMVAIGYLLMLAVMTMNVGYFLAVLGGAFLGELYCGRYSGGVDEHSHH